MRVSRREALVAFLDDARFGALPPSAPALAAVFFRRGLAIVVTGRGIVDADGRCGMRVLGNVHLLRASARREP